MRLLPDRGVPAFVASLALLIAMPVPAQMRAGQGPDEAAIDHAVAQLRKDPNLGGDTQQRSLRWVKSTEPPPPPAAESQWLPWFRTLFDFIAGAGRLVVWIAGGLALALAVIWLIRYFSRKQAAEPAAVPDRPTHVRDLDIRPEALPEDIGGTAQSVWLRGERRAALSLLYRGALSRLVHRFSIRILQSSTEGECLDAATLHMEEMPARYFRDLVGVWQRAVYVDETPDEELVLRLCKDFAPAMDAPRS